MFWSPCDGAWSHASISLSGFSMECHSPDLRIWRGRPDGHGCSIPSKARWHGHGWWWLLMVINGYWWLLMVIDDDDDVDDIPQLMSIVVTLGLNHQPKILKRDEKLDSGRGCTRNALLTSKGEIINSNLSCSPLSKQYPIHGGGWHHPKFEPWVRTICFYLFFELLVPSNGGSMVSQLLAKHHGLCR